jgi:hypothetical protein
MLHHRGSVYPALEWCIDIGLHRYGAFELSINLSSTLPIDAILWVNWLASQERFAHALMRQVSRELGTLYAS